MKSPGKLCQQITYSSLPDGLPDLDNPRFCFNPAIRPAIKWKGRVGWVWYCVKHHPDLEPRTGIVWERAAVPPKEES